MPCEPGASPGSGSFSAIPKRMIAQFSASSHAPGWWEMNLTLAPNRKLYQRYDRPRYTCWSGVALFKPMLAPVSNWKFELTT